MVVSIQPRSYSLFSMDITGVVIGFVQTNRTGFRYNAESNLDLQYAMSLVTKQNITLYQAGDNVKGLLCPNFFSARSRELIDKALPSTICSMLSMDPTAPSMVVTTQRKTPLTPILPEVDTKVHFSL